LARHGLNLEVKRIPLIDVDVANVLLSHPADEEHHSGFSETARFRALRRAAHPFDLIR
jgi:hypothetical protein